MLLDRQAVASYGDTSYAAWEEHQVASPEFAQQVFLPLVAAGFQTTSHSEVGAFYTGNYRNLFAERGYSQSAIQAKLDAAWDSVFASIDDNKRLYYHAGSNVNGPLAYIKDVGHDDVRSEGMAYGMMIAVQMNKQAEFDALWNWARTYMYHDDPSHPCYRYFSWQLHTDGAPMDENSAPDGEEYFAMALYFASGRWGNGTGIYNYLAEANNIVDAMKNREDITGQVYGNGGVRTTTVTSLFNPAEKQVRFLADRGYLSTNGDHTDPSYHLPAFYELFSRWGNPADSGFWREAAQVSRQYFHDTTHDATGLAPDYAHFDGSPKAASWDSGTVNFRFDAWRTAMNWSLDYAWWAADPGQAELSNKILTFFESESVASYGNQYTLDGQRLSSSHSCGLVATNAVASLAATDECACDFVDALWNLPVPTGQWRYYDGMLYFLSLLAVSGNYRIYPPQSQP